MAKVILNVNQMWELSSRKTDNFRKTNSKKKNIFYKLKPGVKGVSLLKKLKPNYSRNFKQVDIMRNKQVDEANIKVDKFSENKNELLMLELYRSWQVSKYFIDKSKITFYLNFTRSIENINSAALHLFIFYWKILTTIKTGLVCVFYLNRNSIK